MWYTIKRYEKDINVYNLLLEDGNTIFVTSLKIMSYATTFMVGMNFTTKRNVVLGTQVDLWYDRYINMCLQCS